MHADATHDPSHKDNMFGICAALGEDFGFDPLWLRLAFGAALLWNMEIVIGAYFALGAVVLVSRLLAPNPKCAAAAPTRASDEAMRHSPQDLDPVDLQRVA